MNKCILFCGLLYSERKFRNNAVALLGDTFSQPEIFSDTLDFSMYSDYYDDEMGKGIIREWVAFSQPITQEHLFEKKLLSIEIENRLRINRKRRINIDPGIVTLSAVQLLTTKDFSHRIYLDQGIYAETTFLFMHKGFHHLNWTYRDYQSAEAEKFFTACRNYLKSVNKKTN